MTRSQLFSQMRANRQKRAAVALAAAERDMRLCEMNWRAAFDGIRPPAKCASNYAESLEIYEEQVERIVARRDAERLAAIQAEALKQASMAAHTAVHFARTGQLPVLDIADWRAGVTVWRDGP
jgi:hypothetical protein